MKRIALVLLAVLIAANGAAEERDPIVTAQLHAAADAQAQSAAGWGTLGFIASALLSPLLGGGGVIAAAYLAEPRVEVPAARFASAQQNFEDPADVLLYQAQYRESLSPVIRKDRARRAWIGTGIGFAVNLILIYSLL